jgi:DNA replication initiation complex subunit (GINS family)
MNLKNEYQKIYEHWLQEFDQIELTALTEEKFNTYKHTVITVNEFELENENEVQSDILNAYKNNLKFLLNDLLKIREIKIMNLALSLIDVNLSNLIEAEKLLYQNLVATIKGYKKVKALSIYDEKKELKDEEFINTGENSTEFYTINADKYHEQKTDSTSKIINPPVVHKNQEKIEYKYILIRFIKKAPPLVGTDLKNYGPFEENDIANIPFQNAAILLNEKYAEKIDLN